MSIDTHSFARRWLERRGMFDADSDYDGALGHEVMRLVDALVQYGHSGYSAAATLKLFNDCMVDYSEGTSEEWREYWNTPEARELVMSTGVPMTADEIIQGVTVALLHPRPRHELSTIASAAERLLRVNQAEKGDSWKQDTVLSLSNAIAHRLQRFLNVAHGRAYGTYMGAGKETPTKDEILERAGSVLCYLMFICDNLGIFVEEEEGEDGQGAAWVAGGGVDGERAGDGGGSAGGAEEDGPGA
jgi:hypothetical protein